MIMSTINERIAREVMGFELNANGMIETWLPPRSDGSTLRHDLCVPDYDTNPADAMAVLKVCLDKVATASLEIYQGCDEGPEYKRSFCIYLEGDMEGVSSPTLEAAICAFALKLFSPAAQAFNPDDK